MPELKLNAGNTGFVFGAAALLLVMIHFYAGPFAPQQSIGVTIGELAAEIRQSATNALKGVDNPAPTASGPDIDQIIRAIAAGLAGLAVIFGLIGAIRKEPGKPAMYAVSLGVGAIVFQFVAWAILLVCGVVLLISTMENIGGILGE